MKRVDSLTVIAILLAVILIAPNAEACEDCGENTGGWQLCWSGQGEFGACHEEEVFDECGEIIATYCVVYYDPWCDVNSGSGWSGGMTYDDWWCFAYCRGDDPPYYY